MPTFVRKLTRVEAQQVPDSDKPTDYLPLVKWCGGALATTNMIDMRIDVKTPYGYEEAWPGDWIVRDADGAFSVCSPDIFEQTYDPVDD